MDHGDQTIFQTIGGDEEYERVVSYVEEMTSKANES